MSRRAVALGGAAALAIAAVLLAQWPPAPPIADAPESLPAPPIADATASLPAPPIADAPASLHAAPVARAPLTGDSTLAQWRAASSAARSQVAVALARNRLAPDATKLEIATAAMEITGCVSATARDTRFDAWKVLPTAATCLTAPEREPK